MPAETVALRVEALGVTWPGRATPVLRDAHLALERGECVGLAGPSGAGKSTLALAMMRLLPERAVVSAGARVMLGTEDLLALDAPEMVKRRGRRIGMVFQEPALALHPAIRVGELLAEGLIAHGMSNGLDAEERAIAMLAKVGVPSAKAASRRYAHEFSGGMRQRILLASALLLEPEVLIVDEPTTALDPTIQAQVLDLMDELRAESGTAMLHISHDLAVLGERADRVLRLESGTIVEAAAGARVFAAGTAPQEPVPAGTPALLDVKDLTVRYAREARWTGPRGLVTAVNGISFHIARGESLALVGESGCGKSSVAHALMRLVRAEGEVRFDGTDLLALHGEPLRRMRQRVQLIAQDAGASLTPHVTVETLVAEGPVAHERATWGEARSCARNLLRQLGLTDEHADALPVELSAGQRQRVAIARALALEPDLLICDEPVSALDAESRAGVLEALELMRRRHTLSLLFITHDLASVMRITSRTMVMYLGRIVETGPTADVMSSPRMPYTSALLDAVPTGDPARKRARAVLAGEPPSPLEPPPGCAFHPRCPHPLKDALCTGSVPPLEWQGVHGVACLKQ